MIKKVVLYVFAAIFVSLVALLSFGYYLKRNEKAGSEPRFPRITKAEVLEKSSAFYRPLFDKLKQIPSVQIGKPYVILSDWPLNGDGICFDVTVNGVSTGEFSDLSLWNQELLGYRCVPDKTLPPYPDSDFFGSSEIEYSAIDLNLGSVEKIVPPNWSFLSNPKICESYIAYWGHADETEGKGNNSKVFAYIYNWVTKEAVVEKQISSKLIATDDSGYFQAPEWSSDCKAATFTDEGVASTLNF